MVFLLTALMVHALPAPVCEDGRVRVRGPLRTRWLQPIEAACTSLASLPDLDPDARVQIEPLDEDVRVEVTLSDGRQARRVLTSPAELAHTLEALLTMPPVVAAPVSPSASSPLPPEATTTKVIDISAATAPLPPTAVLSAPPETFGVELGFGLGARVAGGEPFVAISPSLSAELHAGHWLFGLTFDVDLFMRPIDSTVKDLEMTSVAGGLGIARRFVLDENASFDFGATPRFIVETQSFIAADGTERAFSATDVRLGLLARLGFGGGNWRWVVSFGAELSPARLAKGLRMDPLLEPLPTWSTVLSFGASWGER